MSWLARIWEAIKPDPQFWAEYADWLNDFLGVGDGTHY